MYPSYVIMEPYLRSTDIIDWQDPEVLSRGRELASDCETPEDVTKICFEWVRDAILHIGDHNISTVACTALEVLKTGSGVCYAKSHLLTALLRANGIPAGFCYQRLSVNDNGPPFCLHGLTAVHLPKHGWYRVDARGNNAVVSARFTPPVEDLCYTPRLPGETDLPEIWPDPLPVIIEALRTYRTKDDLWEHLPDIPIITLTQP
jgi:transglutaminase-like putative cysteine protease